MIIAGAGMAGLIAANYFRKSSPVIVEKQPGLPNNHGALLRFRSDKVFNVVGLQAKRVKVRKSIVYGPDFMSDCNPYLANQYSMKVTGRIEDRSIWNLDTEDRYIAPSDFLERMADGCNIEYGREIKDWSRAEQIISTMPMPALMKILGWKDIPDFNFKPIWTITAEIPYANINQTIYFPELDVPYYRASFVGSKVIIEFIREPWYDGGEAHRLAAEVIDYFGIEVDDTRLVIEIKHQKLGKMLPIDEQLRKEFMHHATVNYGVYSLGRFATWRPILLDDVVDDLAVIERMMKSNYDTMRFR